MSQNEDAGKNWGGGENGGASTRRPQSRKRPPASKRSSPLNNGDGVSKPNTQPATTVEMKSAQKKSQPTVAGGAKPSSKPASTISVSPPTKKSRKPAQQLKTISLGDLITDSLPHGMTNNHRSKQQKKPVVLTSQQQEQQLPTAAQPVEIMTRDMEFPKLLSPSVMAANGRGCEPDSALPPKPKAAWGAAWGATTATKKSPTTTPATATTPKAEGDKINSTKRNKNNKRERAKRSTPPTKKDSPTPTLSPSSLLPPPKPSMSLLLTSDPEALRRRQEGLDPKVKEFPPGVTVMNITKGRQRVKPRKKKLTTLKKKVLQERLRQWREMHPIEPSSNALTTTTAKTDSHCQLDEHHSNEWKETSCSICLYGFVVHPDELEDDDEYDEFVSNLRDMAVKVGPVQAVFIPRRTEYYQNESHYPAFVRFVESRDASAAVSCWNGLVVGGQSLEAIHLKNHTLKADNDDGDPEDDWHSLLTSSEAGEADACIPLDGKRLSTIVLENLLTEDDLEDPDCLAETMNDVKTLMDPFGVLVNVKVATENRNWLEVTFECDDATAQVTAAKLTELVVGGIQLVARFKESVDIPQNDPQQVIAHVEMGNALSPEDFEDEECLEECLVDIRTLASEFGSVSDVQVDQEKCIVKIMYDGGLDALENAAKHLDGMTLGGAKVSARVTSNQYVTAKGGAVAERVSVILLTNILTEDDMEDEECLEESLHDIKELAMQFGKVVDVSMGDGDNAGKVRVTYDGGNEVANQAVSGFNSMVVGGQTIQATLLSAPTEPTEFAQPSGSHSQDVAAPAGAAVSTAESIKPKAGPMFSGDKIIPVRFAECKLVPKIPNAGAPRHYARVSNDETIKTLLHEMLAELTRLQRRAVEDKNTKARRRLVMGLREVARGIRAHKVKMVVMANNLDEYGAIDEKLQGILDLAAAEEVPIFFEFGKRALGKAVGKAIKVGVVGIQNSDGADQQFKKLSALSRKVGPAVAAPPSQETNGTSATDTLLPDNDTVMLESKENTMIRQVCARDANTVALRSGPIYDVVEY